MKSLAITFFLLIILIILYLFKNGLGSCGENFNNKNNNPLLSVQDFTKQAIRGEKGDLGLHLLEKNGRISLGGYDDGRSGEDKDQVVQLLLAGKHNSGANNGRKGQTTYKLRIDGYDNDGSTVYPIYLTDEDKNVDFYVKNRSSPGGKVKMYLDGDFNVNKGDIFLGNVNIRHHLMPMGTIVAFNGKTQIPHGWAVCDGSRGTPDLRDRFILGQGRKRLNTRGGLEKVRLSLNEMPRHNHNMDTRGNHNHRGNTHSSGNHIHGISTRQDDYNVSGGIGPSYGADNGYYARRHQTDYAGNHTHSFITSTSGNHSHRIHHSGNNIPHENMPPYHVLIYIMKII